jgi:hypothetical protein
MKYRSIKRPPGKGNIGLDEVLFVVADQSLARGAVLPSERKLAHSLNADSLKLARNVVRDAYEQLMAASKMSTKSKAGAAERTSKKSRKPTNGSSGRSAKSIKPARNVVGGAYEKLMTAGRISTKTKGGATDRTSKNSRKASKGSLSPSAKSVKSPRSSTKKK